MPSNVVNLEEVVPGIEGVTFTLNGQEYPVPGDLPTATVFELLALFESLITFQEESSAKIAKKADAATVTAVRADLKQITDLIDEKLLAIFQIKRPELDELPFGSKSTNYILGEIFALVGIASREGAPTPDLPKPPPTRPRRPSGSSGGRPRKR